MKRAKQKRARTNSCQYCTAFPCRCVEIGLPTDDPERAEKMIDNAFTYTGPSQLNKGDVIAIEFVGSDKEEEC